MTVILTPRLIPRDRIHQNDWNPNEQTDETFKSLVEEIRTCGFGHPLTVVPCGCDRIEGEHYNIIGGEHRWRASGVLEMPEVPAYVQEGWDELQQKLKTVRDNLLTGDLNAKKFTELVRGLSERVDRSMLPKLMGFGSERQFEKYVIKARDEKDKSFIDGLVAESRRERFATDSLHDIIGSILADCGDTLDQDYMIFTHHGKSICVVLCDSKLQRQIVAMSGRLRERGETVTGFMAGAIQRHLEAADEATDC
jgi:hypothetical protein